ncbi:hypothetical protein EZS27_009142 [termite gut metagenome]|uniref:Transposase IS200-like domain-containing protein n=1 Tax=termite gut metagenome TaxID=433724 RepID=A0A5J4SBA6_9ZZZZ
MSQSLSKLYIHIIFHVKSPISTIIRDEDAPDLYAYMGTIIKDSESHPILINGTKDHIHILCVMSKNIALSKLVEHIKRNSSRWIKSKGDYYKNFAWQGGYGGFSVSQSLYAKTKQYIANQKEHHKKMTFREEYVLFLNEYGVDYEKKYIWNDAKRQPE